MQNYFLNEQSSLYNFDSMRRDQVNPIFNWLEISNYSYGLKSFENVWNQM